MILKIFLTLFLCSYIFALEFKVASYNVENLFDMNKDGTEYKEFIPNTQYWNKKALNKKINNISRVINDLDANIISLQEIESKKALMLLLKKIPQYKYHYFLKKKTSAIGLAILSKYKIIENKKIIVSKYNIHSRPILKSTIKINDEKIIIYTNHWKSKRSKESTRIPYAQALLKNIKALNKNTKYIILGDLNSNYDEYITFKYDKKLNDTYGYTGINHILNTSKNGNLIKKNDLHKYKDVHYNLWLELKTNNRFSNKFRDENQTPDNIIISPSLLLSDGIKYKQNSFRVFKKDYLFKNKIYRWNGKKQNGYSDHLPIYATFTNNYYEIKKNKNIVESSRNTIDYLYKIEKLNKNILLKNVIVIFKYKNKAIIKTKNSRAILIYQKNNNLKLAYSYDLLVQNIDNYYGLKEITKMQIVKKLEKVKSYKNLYLQKNITKLINENNQNEIILNIKVKYDKNYLYLDNKKVSVYFEKNIKKPKDGDYIHIKIAHISNYRKKTQLHIYKQEDFNILY